MQIKHFTTYKSIEIGLKNTKMTKSKKTSKMCLFDFRVEPKKKIVAAFRGMHVSPAKHSSASVTDRRTDRRTDDGQSDPYVSLCFAWDTKMLLPICF